MIKHFGYNFKIATEAIIQNKLRSVLTSLGIIFGVSSVIAMLAIGSGAEQAILEKMKLLGTNNIIILPLDREKQQEISDESEENSDKKEGTTEKFTPGFTLNDLDAITKIVKSVTYASPEIIYETDAMHSSLSTKIKLVGILPEYFKINNFSLSKGNQLHESNYKFAENVCIIGYSLKTRLFPTDDPIGKFVKCGEHWLKVVGIMDERSMSKENIQSLNIRDYNLDIYIPINTMLLRYINRSLVTKQDFLRERGDDSKKIDPNYHQVDRAIIHFAESGEINKSVEIIERLLLRRHNGVKDFEIVVPELLLQQEQSTKRIFNIVLGAIASISLIVGGIGIMNIMLASVMERTKEIGIRKAVGARRSDILTQFLLEAVAISMTGGIIGIILGVTVGILIETLTGITTIITPESVFLSFFVSISVGLIFGITPARRASKQNPIELLRYE
ncbi:MAG: ABC transporter permease [Desulfobulbaceae bacterium]|nr:ABC transporter permease [Candidatus Kapabacteria bacterium]MBS4001465.1 ABC transporter permease [Desulfobulbaceae bacterium]